MRYFTPELFVRLQTDRDPQSILATSEEWERALAGYQARLKEIAPLLADGPARLVGRRSLHDATVLEMWHEKTEMTIALQEEARPGEVLVLHYSLIEPPCIDPAALPEQYRAPEAAWLYDEIDAESGLVFDPVSGIQVKPAGSAAPGEEKQRASVFTHSILLSNGWEIRLRFHRLEITSPHV